jgi:hypothetical protein
MPSISGAVGYACRGASTATSFAWLCPDQTIDDLRDQDVAHIDHVAKPGFKWPLMITVAGIHPGDQPYPVISSPGMST